MTFLFGFILPATARLGKQHLLSINKNYVVAINNKYCRVWHENSLAAEANEAEGPDAEGLPPPAPPRPTSWWETLILRPQQTGRPCLDKWFSSRFALRQQGCGVVAPVCPQAGGGGPWFSERCPPSHPLATAVVLADAHRSAECLRVCISSGTHARRCLIRTFGAP